MTTKTLLLFLLPVISAFIGWFTNWVAVKMLFHPREPKNILGIRFQGIFPKRQAQFAQQLGRTVAGELLHFRDIAAQMTDPVAIKALMPGIEAHIDGFLNERIKEKIPMLAMFMSEGVAAMIKTGLMEEIEAMLPQIITQYAGSLEEKIDIERMVTEKVAAFSSDRLEALLLAVMSKELRFVELIGGVLGFVIGLLQLTITLL